MVRKNQRKNCVFNDSLEVRKNQEILLKVEGSQEKVQEFLFS